MNEDLSDRLRHLVDRARPVDLDEVTHRSVAPARNRLVLVAAGLFTVVAVIGAVALLRLDRGDDDPTPVTAPTTTVAPPSTTTAPTTSVPVTTIPPAAGVPAEFVGVTTDGRLVVVDVATGEEVRELARMGDPTAPHDGADGPGDNVIDSVEVVPGSVVGGPAQVLFGDCCEPAVGSVYGMGLDGSPTTLPVNDPLDDRGFLFAGYDPAVRSDGTVVVADSGAGAVSLFPLFDPSDRTAVDPDHAGAASSPTWMSTGVAYEVLGEQRTLAVDDGGPITFLEAPGASTWTNPLELADGLLVVEQCCGDFAQEHETAVGRVIDPQSGTVLRSLTYDGVVLDQDLAESGRLLITHLDGRVVSMDPMTGASVVIATGFSAASW